MSAGNWGGSAASGGFDFQAAASALCMVHMATGIPLGWSSAQNDTPLKVSAETASVGDDITLTLADGSVVEIQAKKRLKDSDNLWDSLIALCQGAHDCATLHGVLAVGPTTSITIRDQLARDIIRIGQNRIDDLSKIAIKFTEKLSSASIPLSVCSRVRIQTLHVLEQDGASTLAAIANLKLITTQPNVAWDRLKSEALRMITLRSSQDMLSISKIIPDLRTGNYGGLCPIVVVAQLTDWILNTTTTFTIPSVNEEFSLEDDWIELKAYGHEKNENGLTSIEEALNNYREGASKRKHTGEQDSFDAESLGYFIRHCVIVAGPGMGKSQLLRRIARLLARKNEPSLLVHLRPLAERMRTGETFLDAALRLGLDSSPLNPQDIISVGVQNFGSMPFCMELAGRCDIV